jgi:hypothetical protein
MQAEVKHNEKKAFPAKGFFSSAGLKRTRFLVANFYSSWKE